MTTEEELEAYFIIKNLLKDVVDLQDITYKDTESYINILYKKNTRKWICRLRLTDTVKTLIVPDEEKKGQKFNLTSVYDLEQYNDLLHKILARYMWFQHEKEGCKVASLFFNGACHPGKMHV